MNVVLRYFDGCPHWKIAQERLRLALDVTGHGDVAVRLEKVDSPEDAERFGFMGSPSIVVDGRDLFSREDEPVGFACRIYSTPTGPGGSPTQQQLEEILR